ncbi:MAG TPA: hypothetical protein VKE22_20915, partial [Haliangiales bacterium]|nr:hypothetical protein [Haliangiales bacterium]
DAGAWTVELDVPGGPFRIVHTPRAGGFTPAGSPAALTWAVTAACADVEARWLGDAGRGVLRGRGYADRVTLHRIARRLGLRRVDWGRAHVGDITIVWNRIEAERGTWSCTLATDGVRRDEGHDVELCEVGPALAPRGLELAEGRVLHDGPAMDEERVPSAAVRGLVRLVSPPIAERRWVRRARLRGRAGWALHEHVRFGRSGGGA